MNKVTLYLLLGAACASSWWAFATWANRGCPGLIIPALVASVLVFFLLAIETYEIIDKDKR